MMTKKRIIIGLVLIVCMALFLRGCLHKKKQPPVSSVSVTTAQVVQKDVTLTAHAIGNVQPTVAVSIKSRVEGQLLSVGFKEGEYVKEGQLIFEIDPHPFQVALEQAKANLARDEAQLENFQKLLVRYGQLVKKGYISKQDYDASEANMKAQAASVLADKALVSNAELNLGYCTIRAPISGRTGNLLVNQGNLIKANDSAPLVIIHQIKPIYVAFSLPEAQLEAVKKAANHGTVYVAIQTKNSNTKLIAKLSFIDNSVDRNTGMILLKALYPNSQEEIWPGQYVDVTLPITEIKNALLLATRAIQEGPDGSYVFIVNKDSNVTLKPIKLGAVVNDSETIVNDLPVGTKVVATGQSQLIDGSKVQVIPESAK
jgi:multidrug efflux system membrane fusion protein